MGVLVPAADKGNSGPDLGMRLQLPIASSSTPDTASSTARTQPHTQPRRPHPAQSSAPPRSLARTPHPDSPSAPRPLPPSARNQTPRLLQPSALLPHAHTRPPESSATAAR